MEYRRFGDKIVARLDKGEEICSTLLDLAGREGIRLASVSGIGASNDITLGVFRTKKKEYVQNRYYGIDYELASVTGIEDTAGKRWIVTYPHEEVSGPALDEGRPALSPPARRNRQPLAQERVPVARRA